MRTIHNLFIHRLENTHQNSEHEQDSLSLSFKKFSYLNHTHTHMSTDECQMVEQQENNWNGALKFNPSSNKCLIRCK